MSLTKATYSMIDGAVGNVKDYGAAPSASAATNNAAFNAALAAHTAVFVPSDGEYTISAVVLEASGRHLFGENAKLKVASGTTGNAIKIGPASGGWASRVKNTQITGITVDASLAAGANCIRAEFVEGIKFSNVNTNGGLRGLDVNTAASVHVDTCNLGAASAHALLIESATDGIGTWAWVTNSIIYGSGDGIIISNFPSVWVDKNVIFSHTGYGLTVQMDVAYTTSGTYAVITDNDFDSCGEQGLILSNQTKFVVKGNWVSCGRTAPENGISLFACRRGSISENQIFSCGLSGLWMDGCNDISVVNNTSTDNTVAGVYVANTDRVQIIGNVLAKTPEQFLPTPMAYGAYIFSGSYANVIANTIYGVSTAGILNNGTGDSRTLFNTSDATTADASLQSRHSIATSDNASYHGHTIYANKRQMKYFYPPVGQFGAGQDATDFYTAGGASALVQMRITENGNVGCRGAFSGGQTLNDFAEFFEWSDGNPDDEDRIGQTVVAENGKIRNATATDDVSKIIGAVSGTAGVVLGCNPFEWGGKYVLDDFGRAQTEPFVMIHWKDEKGEYHHHEDGKVPDGLTVPDSAERRTYRRPVVSTTFDGSVEYVERGQRKEWAVIGLLGQVRIRNDQTVNPSWVKLRDISDSVSEWLVK